MIRGLIDRARRAQKQIDNYTQEQIDQVCLSVGWQVYKDDNISLLAKSAVEETHMGVYEDKILKHQGKVLSLLRDLRGAKSVGLIERDEKRGISKYAKPVGVVGALTPVTNPTATPASNALSILKGKNAVIFAPHPGAKKSSKLAVDMMREGVKRVGAPEDLIQVIEEPSLDLTSELMRQVDLVVATGGGAMVKAAYSSGTPAYGVGPGNSVQIIAEDADLVDAAKKVAMSKTFDNATSCSSENSIIVHRDIYDEFMAELKKNNGYLCNADEKKKLEDWMWVPNKKGHIALNPQIIARDATKIARDAGFAVPDNIRMLMVEGEMPPATDTFFQEKISPVLTIWKCSSFSEAFEILQELTDLAGTGHSCGIHTFKQEYIDFLAEKMKTSRIMVRQPQAQANGGNFFNGMPATVTLGCGTWGGNITTENINYRHFINVTWVAEPIKPEKPTDEEIWGGFWARYGR
ncbi:MAG TPA: aldehyde dehydrogenase family protein [Clostridia bacterium]|nr:aldehyde dehydrogenase family protein [Clostridia bacterium]